MNVSHFATIRNKMDSECVCKIAAMPFPTRYVKTINESFHMRFYVSSILKGHQSYQKSKLKFSKKVYLLIHNQI